MLGSNLVKEFIDKYKTRPILVYFDPDPDGLFSGYFICKLLESLGLQYSYYMNSKRRHGFDLEPSSVQGFFIIAVDFGVTSALVESLVANNVAFLNLDHHDTETEFIYIKSDKTDASGVVINNQYPFEPEDNRYLSGAGVVYESICDCYPDFKTRENDAIVGITLLTDACPIENKKAELYLNRTYSADTQSGYLGYLVSNTLESDYGFGVPRLDRNYIDYTFSPRLNSMLRFNRTTEALNFILGRGISTVNTRKLQKDYIEYLLSIAETTEYTNLVVGYCDVTKIPSEYRDIDATCFIGTVCSKLKGDKGNAIAYVVDNGRVARASFRGRYSDVHYRVALKNIGLKAEGHPNAFGILDLEPSDDLWTEVNEIIYDLEKNHEQTYRVVTTPNLSTLMLQSGTQLANKNCYVRDAYRTYIKYTGNSIKLMVDKDNFQEYMIDGRSVKSFNKELTPRNSYILPMLEKSHVVFYLRDTAI